MGVQCLITTDFPAYSYCQHNIQNYCYAQHPKSPAGETRDTSLTFTRFSVFFATSLNPQSKSGRATGTKWFLCMLTIILECYGWVALALPVYAKVSWDPERPLNKPDHTGRASAT